MHVWYNLTYLQEVMFCWAWVIEDCLLAHISRVWEGGEERAGHRMWRCAHGFHPCQSPSHPCLVQSVHTLILCKPPPLTRAACLPSGDGLFSLLCQIPYTKLHSWYADGYQQFNPIHTSEVIIKSLIFTSITKHSFTKSSPTTASPLQKLKSVSRNYAINCHESR